MSKTRYVVGVERHDTRPSLVRRRRPRTSRIEFLRWMWRKTKSAPLHPGGSVGSVQGTLRKRDVSAMSDQAKVDYLFEWAVLHYARSHTQRASLADEHGNRIPGALAALSASTLTAPTLPPAPPPPASAAAAAAAS